MALTMTTRKIEVTMGSGNVFADLDLPDADDLLLKSDLAVELRKLIEARRLSQASAAAIIGISQPDLSRILRGRVADYSAGRLMRMLTLFDSDVEIVRRPHRKAGKPGRIIFKPSAV